MATLNDLSLDTIEQLDFPIQCEIMHWPDRYPCSGEATYVRYVSCVGAKVLMCENAAKFGPLSRARRGELHVHDECARPVLDCWTEVPL